MVPTTVVLIIGLMSATGCGNESLMEIRVDRVIFDSDEPTRFSVSVRDRENRTFALTDFSDEGSGLPSTRPFEVPESGVVVIEPRLEIDGESVTEGSVEIDLRDDFEWSVTIFRQEEDPADSCFGCIGTQRISIDREFREQEDEALWVAWGGSSDGDDVVF